MSTKTSSMGDVADLFNLREDQYTRAKNVATVPLPGTSILAAALTPEGHRGGALLGSVGGFGLGAVGGSTLGALAGRVLSGGRNSVAPVALSNLGALLGGAAGSRAGYDAGTGYKSASHKQHEEPMPRYTNTKHAMTDEERRYARNWAQTGALGGSLFGGPIGAALGAGSAAAITAPRDVHPADAVIGAGGGAALGGIGGSLVGSGLGSLIGAGGGYLADELLGEDTYLGDFSGHNAERQRAAMMLGSLIGSGIGGAVGGLAGTTYGAGKGFDIGARSKHSSYTGDDMYADNYTMDKVAYAQGAVTALYQRGISPEEFIEHAATTRDPNLIKVAELILEGNELVKLSAGKMEKVKDLASAAAEGLRRHRLDYIDDAADAAALEDAVAASVGDELGDLSRKALLAGGVGLAGLGAGGAGLAYGMGDADIAENRVRDALGLDTVSRIDRLRGLDLEGRARGMVGEEDLARIRRVTGI